MNALDRARSLVSGENYPAAVCEFREHLASSPGDVQARYEYAGALCELRQYEAAWKEARICTVQNARHGESWNLLGNLCAPLGRHADAGKYYLQSLNVAPQSPLTHWNLALWQIGQGNWEDGWRGYQWGVAAGMRPVRTLAPEWDGKPLKDKTLFVWAEQGIGDTLMCLQLIAAVYARNPECRIVLEVPASLLRLCQENRLTNEVFATTADKSVPFPFEKHCSLMSLPRLLGLTPDTFPAPVPRLHANAADVKTWGEQIDPYQFNVGLVWAGSPSHAGDKDRSLPLQAFAPLLDLPATFYSLQYGYALQLLQKQASQVIPLGHAFKDFADTAAAISLLDLVITCDTSVAHLAGAMGKKVWNLISAVPDYRWMHERDDTPWYESMTLYRQFELGAWSEVIQRVRTDLQELIQCQ